jgi:signal transduction histidine kinase
MRNMATDSFNIVRGILETNHIETTPFITSTLREHASKVAQRANLEISFNTTGIAVKISIETQRAVFYAFQEILSNIEKHAQANQVNICAKWDEDFLTITVSDNGVGFNPDAIDQQKHFGLGILYERISQVNGTIELKSAENSGTVVTLSVPIGQNYISLKTPYYGASNA